MSVSSGFSDASERFAVVAGETIEALQELLEECQETRRRAVAGSNAAWATGDIFCQVGAVLGANPNSQSAGSAGSVTVGAGRGLSGFDENGRPIIVDTNTLPDQRRREIAARTMSYNLVLGAAASLCATGNALRRNNDRP